MIYEYVRHRKVSSLDLTNCPEKATHVATLPNGVKYFVRFDENQTCWIQLSDQYGTGYAYSGLYQVGCTFQPIIKSVSKLEPPKILTKILNLFN